MISKNVLTGTVLDNNDGSTILEAFIQNERTKRKTTASYNDGTYKLDDVQVGDKIFFYAAEYNTAEKIVDEHFVINVRLDEEEN